MSTRLSRSLAGLVLLAAIAAACFVVGPSRQAPQGSWMVNAVNWSSTGETETAPSIGNQLTPGQRISTAKGQNIEFYAGRTRIALKPNTTILVGDDDPATQIGNFELVAGSISVTVRRDDSVTIDAPRLKATTRGADFLMNASEQASKIRVQAGAVTLLSNGTTTELGTDQVAIVAQAGEEKPQIMTADAAREAAALAANAWKLKEIRLDNADPELDPTTLPKPGAHFTAGAQISTMLGSEIWLERDTANGRDVVQILPKSIVTVGDADPETERPDLAILAGGMKIKADHALFVYAPHLTTTIENGLAAVSTNPQASGVKTVFGTVKVTSILTGETHDVPSGVTQLVRAENTPPIAITPDMGHVEQMQ